MKLAALGSLLLCLGCSSVGVTRARSAASKPSDCRIDIFSSDAEVKRPFEVVCLLDSRTGGTLFDDKTAAGAIQNAKSQACGCGADAMIVTGADTEGPGRGGGWGQGKALLKAIRYLDTGSAPTASGTPARLGNATVRAAFDGAPSGPVDAEIDGRSVNAVYLPTTRMRLALKDCALTSDLKASCVGVLDRAIVRIDIDARP